MSATTAVATSDAGRLGVMVRSATQVVVYWEARKPYSLRLRVTDLTGRAPSESLDGTGSRELAVKGTVIYVDHLIPGRLYGVALGLGEGDAFRSLIFAGPVQTPWRPTTEAPLPPFPAPYHRS